MRSTDQYFYHFYQILLFINLSIITLYIFFSWALKFMIILISFYNRLNTELIVWTVTWFQSENKASKASNDKARVVNEASARDWII